MKQKGLLLSFKHFTDSILLKMAVITLDSHREAACQKKLFPFLPMPLMIKKKKIIYRLNLLTAILQLFMLVFTFSGNSSSLFVITISLVCRTSLWPSQPSFYPLVLSCTNGGLATLNFDFHFPKTYGKYCNTSFLWKKNKHHCGLDKIFYQDIFG